LIGYCERWGGYFQLRDVIRTANLIEDKLKYIDENFYGGEKNYFRSSVTAGAMLRLFSFMYVYGGLGYGKYGAVYEVDEKYYTVGLIKGLELEYGVTFRLWRLLSLTAGYSTIANSNFGELHFGIGFDLIGRIR
jgi:hypothetical protein